jgi:hypothetical protein
MNIKFFNVALGIALTATTFAANAQKVYTEGTITISTAMRGQTVQPKVYFTKDSTALAFMTGPASIRVLTDDKQTSMAILLSVPVASLKKAAIATPAEVEQTMSEMPKLTFAPTTETKQISGFNCKKVVATDDKGKKYDVWITNDFSLPEGAIAPYYKGISGVPIQYTSFSMGQTADVTILSITADKAPAGTFAIPADYDKITMEVAAAESNRL